MVLQSGHGIFLSHAVAGSLSTTEPCRQLHIQHVCGVHQHTSSNMLALTRNDATLVHEVLTNFALNLMQPIRDADRPSGPQACAVPNQT